MAHRIIANATDMDALTWYPIPGYEGLYEITRDGRIRRLPRFIRAPQNGGHRLIGFREIKIQSIKGYAGFVATGPDGRKTSLYVHRVLAMLFVPNLSSKPHVNHIDGNKANNDLSNLEWVTHQENMRHAFDTGLTPRPASGPGEESPAAKLNWGKVERIRAMLAKGKTHKEIASEFGVKKGAIGCIARNETWKVEA